MRGAIVTAGCGAAVLFLGIGLGAAGARAQPLATPTYTDAQAKRGKAAYLDHCVSCHGDQLDNGTFGPALAGPAFLDHWKAKSLDEPFIVMSTTMPPDSPGGLNQPLYADVMAYVLSENGIAPSTTELPFDVAKLKTMAAPR